MASLDALPGTSSSAASSSASRKAAAVFKAAAAARSAASAAAAGSGDVSAKTVISVFVVLGAFLVVSVVGAAVTFVETQAKDARNHNHSAPLVEFIQFAPNETLPAQQPELQPAPERLQRPGSLPPRLEERSPPPLSTKDAKMASDREYTSDAPSNGTFSLGRMLDALAAGRDVRMGAERL